MSPLPLSVSITQTALLNDKVGVFVNNTNLTFARLAQLDQHQTCKPLMVSIVSSNPTGGNFIFLRHLDANFVQK